jgi:HlyD family secretion protein
MNSTKSIIIFFIISLIAGCSDNNDENRIEASGTIESVTVTLSSKIPGEIKSIKFKEGDKISKGDTILLIDNEHLLIQLRNAEAAKLMAEAQLLLLKKGARDEDIAQAEAGLKQAEVNLQIAEKDLRRFRNLFDEGSITKKQMDDVNARYELSLSQHLAMKENLAKVKNISRPEEIKQAEAKLLQAIANEDLIKKNIKDSYIVSPLDGFIVDSFFEEGEVVSQMSSLVKISNLSEVELNIYLSEEELAKVKLGDDVTVKIDAYPEKNYKGRITFISSESEFTPKNIQTKDERTKLVFKVKLKIPNENFELKTGMPADAYLN